MIGVVGLCHFQPQQVQLPRATLHSPGAMNQLQLLLRAVRLSFVLCVFLCLGLILLSGDVELNPGPTIDDQPDLSLLVKWLEPLHDWKSFGLLLPGVTQEDITTIEEFGTSTVQGKTGLFSKWLKKYPTATWKDVLDALYKKEEYQLVKIIEDHLSGKVKTAANHDCETIPMIFIISNLAIKIFRSHYASLTSIISTNLTKVTNALYAEELIPMNIVEDMLIEGIGDSKKASKLLLVITRHLESSQSRTQYLIDVCYVLANQEHKALADISTAILHDLGCASVIAEKHIDLDLSATPDIVLQYANNLRRCYKDQPIVNADWPPRIGEYFFGRLALVEKQDSTIKDQKSAWYLLRGQVDEIIEMPENTEIQIEDILKPTETALSLRVVIDGPPGIGKTTLCRKLLNMWSHGPGELPPCQYDLVLYCPLRHSKIATATTLADLLVPCCYEAHILVEWFEKKNGEGLLIIFDGWDELSMSSRSSSFAKAIIRREQLSQCSVIVTSRSYASSSLLKMDSISRYIQVIGFRKEEIATVIIRKIQKDPELALELIEAYEEMINNQQDFDDDSSSDRINVDFKWLELCSNSDSQLAVKLINDLEVRGDVCSLCYIPLICSMVILVYCKENGSLPTTLTQLYENFILQTIKRQAEKCGKDAYDLPNNLLSLPSQLALQELCRLAYTNLVKKKMIFTSDQLKELSLSKEDYLGLITSFIEFDEKKYQFLHLSIQEFLAAWWIAKHEKKTEEVFKDHFDDDHFRMCLRFVAGLTNLEHESYEQYFNKQLDLICRKPP
uniref:NACHT domain-containing protein n=1 Tax=Amphimedon queenslandica TaxID=400682 RepID=A0A1X7SVN8_AMPQE